MDRLTLRIENRSDAAGDMPEDISVLGKGITIGRKATNDWSLPDNTRFISGKHIDITFEDGSYILEDVSTNGTFVNGNSKRIDGKHTLSNGDTIRVGSYIVAVVIAKAEESERPTFTGAQGVQAPPTGGTVRTPNTGIQRHTPAASSAGRAQTPDFSQFKTGITGATGVQRPGGGAVSQPPVLVPAPAAEMIPDDFDDDLLGLSPSEPEPEQAAEPEPAPEPERAATPAPAAEPKPEPAPEAAPTPPPDATPASSIIPVAEPAPEPAADAAPVFKRAAPIEPAPKPVSQASPSSQSGPFSDTGNDAPAAPAPDLKPAPARNSDGPFSLSDPTAAPIVPLDPVPVSAQVVEKTDLTPQGLGERFAETTPPRAKPVPEPAPTPEPSPAAPVAAAPVAQTAAEAPATPAAPAINELLEGFLEGAEVEDPDTLAIPLRELGVMLGKCARLGTQEMMQMLQDRSAVKLFVAQEDRTMRIASGNNPMKFMMDPDDAFKALFVEPRDGYQTGPDGFDNALTDIRQHQQAMMAAIQPALADMLEGLAPTEISNDVGGGGGVLGSGARKSWEEYTKRWESRAAQGENGMLDAFIDAFSRRYNQALDSL